MATFRPKATPVGVEKNFGQQIKTKPFITLFLLQSLDGKLAQVVQIIWTLMLTFLALLE